MQVADFRGKTSPNDHLGWC